MLSKSSRVNSVKEMSSDLDPNHGAKTGSLNDTGKTDDSIKVSQHYDDVAKS